MEAGELEEEEVRAPGVGRGARGAKCDPYSLLAVVVAVGPP